MGQDSTGLTCRTVRQLSVLRSTYPGWEIQHMLGATSGTGTWTAELRRPRTPAMAAAGVEMDISRPDAASLASALARQAELIHTARATHPFTGRPGGRVPPPREATDVP